MDTYLLLLPVEQLPSVMCDVPYAEVRHVEWKVEEGIVGGEEETGFHGNRKKGKYWMKVVV